MSAPHTVPAEVDGAAMRSVLGHFATGVVAITAIDPEAGYGTGLAANSFTSVSLDPPLVAFCIAHTSTSWPGVKRAGTFAINILSEGQEDVGRQLSRKGADKFEGLAWQPSPQGAPFIDDSAAWIEAELEAEHEAGDHVIVVARVNHLYADERAPLVFHRGKYGRLADS